MKKLNLLCILPLLALCACKTPSPISHALFQQSVTLAEQYALIQHPEVTPDIRAASEVVCSVAHGTNANPAAIVAALSAAHLTNQNTILIVNGGLALLNTVVAAIGPKTNEIALYSQDLCLGMVNGLPVNGRMKKHSMGPALTSPHLQ
jgi:hypothetical protein